MNGPATGARANILGRWFWGIVLAAGVMAYLWLRVAEPLGIRPFVDVGVSRPNPETAHPFGNGLHGNDFKHIYLGAWMLDNGMNPYDVAALQRMAALRGFESINPYVYLPFTGIVMAPLAWLDPPEALRVWFVLNHLFLLGGFALAFWSLGLRPTLRDAAVWTCLVAAYFPLTRTLTAGQLNCALFFLFALVYALDRRGWPVAAGVVAAFAFLYKLAPGILLAWFLWRAVGEVLAWRRAAAAGQSRTGVSPVSPGAGTEREPEPEPGPGPEPGPNRRDACSTLGRLPAVRAALAMVVATGLLLGLSVARVGWPTHLAFRPLLEQMGYGRSTWAEFGQHFYRDPENQSFNSLFHHLLAGTGRGTKANEEDGTTQWIDLGPVWANGLTRAAFLVCLALVLWRTRRRLGPGIAELHSATHQKRAEYNSAIPGGPYSPDACESMDADRAASYGLFVLLGLLAPSIYWDHYAVIALWPLLAVYARLPEQVRGGAFVVAAGAWLALSAFREMGGWGTSASLAVAAGGAAWLVLRTTRGEARRGEGVAAIAWGVAAALLGARYAFGVPGLRQGVGLLGMSIGLWGTLILFGLCLAKGGEAKREERRVKCEV